MLDETSPSCIQETRQEEAFRNTQASNNRMPILITGHNGMLGKALLRCKQGRDVVVDSLKRDLRDLQSTKNLFDEAKPTSIIHLAAKVGGLFDNAANNAAFLEDNIRINLNVLSCASNTPTLRRCVSMLSTCIFPAQSELPLTPEKCHLGPPHPSNIGYSFAKRLLQVHGSILNQWSDKQQYISIIPTNMYGPDDRWDVDRGHVIPALIRKCHEAKVEGSPWIILGDGKDLRQFLFAEDAARMIWALHDMENFDEFELIFAPPEEYSISQVVQLIGDIMDFDGEIVYKTDVVKGQHRKTADGRKATILVQSVDKTFQYTSLRDGLKKTIDAFHETFMD